MPGVLEKTTTPCNETLMIEIMIFWVFHTIGLTKYSFLETIRHKLSAFN